LKKLNPFFFYADFDSSSLPF